jgi:hypothetical protein
MSISLNFHTFFIEIDFSNYVKNSKVWSKKHTEFYELNIYNTNGQ